MFVCRRCGANAVVGRVVIPNHVNDIVDGESRIVVKTALIANKIGNDCLVSRCHPGRKLQCTWTRQGPRYKQ
jgi:hypothetical protein